MTWTIAEFGCLFFPCLLQLRNVFQSVHNVMKQVVDGVIWWGCCDNLLSPTMKWTRPHDNFCSPSPTLLTPSLSEILSNWTKSNNQSIIQSINQTIDKSINHQSLYFGASVLWLLWGKTIHVKVLKRWNKKNRGRSVINRAKIAKRA